VTAAWIAVLVVVNNCTRRSLGLPLFAVGAHVTAELVAEALAALLPEGLAYLITDGGAHFTADVVQELEKGRGFVRVPLAKHRPRSNGIAERFIETLKAWLANKEWKSAEELEALLVAFLAEYNDWPHQGRELAGLSPNEYAARLGVI
jgi:transposase InsO family protein